MTVNFIGNKFESLNRFPKNLNPPFGTPLTHPPRRVAPLPEREGLGWRMVPRTHGPYGGLNYAAPPELDNAGSSGGRRLLQTWALVSAIPWSEP
jgi:hypothetical protein